jgi:hypothetical protein
MIEPRFVSGVQLAQHVDARAVATRLREYGECFLGGSGYESCVTRYAS